MAFSYQLFLLFVLILSISIISHSADLITKECGQNITSNDILQGNINTVILDLVTKTTAAGFANSTYGSGNDTVYGIAECRGDISGDACSACVIDAGQQIRTACANTTESRIWYHQCSLRYSTSNFIGQPDTNMIGVWTSTGNVTDPLAFKQALEELFEAVTLAGSDGRNRKFSLGAIHESHNLENEETINIYGMVQCTWDLQEITCIQCLNAAFTSLQSRCGDLNGCFVILKSCAIRYEASPFLFLDAASNSNVTTRNITVSNI